MGKKKVRVRRPKKAADPERLRCVFKGCRKRVVTPYGCSCDQAQALRRWMAVERDGAKDAGYLLGDRLGHAAGLKIGQGQRWTTVKALSAMLPLAALAGGIVGAVIYWLVAG